MPKLTKEKAAEYLQKGGVRCPHCGSDGLDTGTMQTDVSVAWQSVTCASCHEEWTDRYDLAAFTELDDPDYDWCKSDLIPPDNHVWVVIYTHRQGLDVFAALTEDAAHKHALFLVKTWRGEFYVDPELSDEEALADWMECTGGREMIETNKVMWVELLEQEGGGNYGAGSA